MISIGKILGLAVILFVVWQVFRFLETQRKSENHKALAEAQMSKVRPLLRWLNVINAANGIKLAAKGASSALKMIAKLILFCPKPAIESG